MKIKYYSHFLIFILMLTSFSCKHKQENIIQRNKKIEPIENINFILENSASMQGFLNGNDFKKTITGLLADLDGMKTGQQSDSIIKRVNIYTVSDNLKLVRYNGSSFDFNFAINNAKIATGKSSPIDEITKSIIDTSRKNSVNILVSDMLIDNKRTPNMLPTIQSNYNLIFNEAKKNNIALSIYRFISEFNGFHYYVQGGKAKLSHVQRPYYILFTGSQEYLEMLRNKLKSSENFKYENEIQFNNTSEIPQYTVLWNTLKKGTWKYKNEQLEEADIKNGEFRFVLGVDLSSYPNFINDSSYLQNNFEIEYNNSPDLTREIYPKSNFIKKIDTKDLRAAQKYTHFIVVNLKKLTAKDEDIEFELYKKLPEWYTLHSCTDDSGIPNKDMDKTFAIKEIINGIANAYGDLNSNKQIFHFKIKICR